MTSARSAAVNLAVIVLAALGLQQIWVWVPQQHRAALGIAQESARAQESDSHPSASPLARFLGQGVGAIGNSLSQWIWAVTAGAIRGIAAELQYLSEAPRDGTLDKFLADLGGLQ